ncbi:MAG: 2Fe-2S iron-sulfur cluster-binding protein, partial [Thermodesulfobacteriota bacterium]
RVPRCGAPFYQAYDVLATEDMTILDALMKLASEDDPTIAFRKSCRSAICGSCAISLNGFPKLACSTLVLPEYKKAGKIELGPLSNYPVIKDLVVDFDGFWKKMEAVTPYLTPVEGETRVVTKDDVSAIDRSSKCVMCGSCNAVCNSEDVDSSFVGPSAFTKAWRFVGDVREGDKNKRLHKLSSEHGVWDCVRCVHCAEYCPKDVGPLEAIERLRSEAVKEGITDNHGAKHVLAMAESVKRVGRLDEAAMTFKTLGFLRSLGMIPFGIKMELHGKMPHPIIFPAIDNIEEVRAIFEAVEKKKKGIPE